MNHYLFRTDTTSPRQVDSAKSLIVPAGTDTLDDIGIPRGARRESFEKESFQARILQWSRVVAEFYPVSTKSK